LSARELTTKDGTTVSPAAGGNEERYLLPGELFVSAQPVKVKTILGSCIAVCLWDTEQRIGGINHFLLPHGVKSFDNVGRFGNLALPELLDQLRAIGAHTRSMSAKIFGGAALVVPVPPPNHIGAQNLEVAERWLQQVRIPLLASDTGGPRGRKLVFDIGDGSASLWTL
jgi:chemotaxis protein CheD